MLFSRPSCLMLMYFICSLGFLLSEIWKLMWLLITPLSDISDDWAKLDTQPISSVSDATHKDKNCLYKFWSIIEPYWSKHLSSFQKYRQPCVEDSFILRVFSTHEILFLGPVIGECKILCTKRPSNPYKHPQRRRSYCFLNHSPWCFPVWFQLRQLKD